MRKLDLPVFLLNIDKFYINLITLNIFLWTIYHYVYESSEIFIFMLIIYEEFHFPVICLPIYQYIESLNRRTYIMKIVALYLWNLAAILIPNMFKINIS